MQQPAEPLTLSSEEGEALIAQVHQSNVPAAAAAKLAQIVRLYFWLVFALQEATLSVKRLRNLLFGSNAQPQEWPEAQPRRRRASRLAKRPIPRPRRLAQRRRGMKLSQGYRQRRLRPRALSSCWGLMSSPGQQQDTFGTRFATDPTLRRPALYP